MTRDFPDERAEAGSWWDWKPAKRALEYLFHVGELLIHERRGFQKVYALADDVLAPGTETRYPTDREMARYLVDLTLRNTPISRGRYFSSQHRHGVGGLEKGIREEIDAGRLAPVEVESTGTWYCRPELLETPVSRPEEDQVRVLSPFDGLVIQRDWFEALFGFRYQIECYVPAAKRVYGYFSLPVLWSHGFAGLLDAKAERTERVLRVISLHLAPAVAGCERFRSAFHRELDAFARFNGCDGVRFEPGAERLLDTAE